MDPATTGRRVGGWPTIEGVELSLRPVGRVPLRAGLVQGVRAPVPTVYAQLRYLLEGALPDAELVVTLLVHPFDPTGTNSPLPFSAVALRTDAAGSGRAEVSVRREEVPLSVRGAEHGVRWQVTRGDELVYRSECAALTLD